MHDNFGKVATNSEKWFVNVHGVISPFPVRDAFFFFVYSKWKINE